MGQGRRGTINRFNRLLNYEEEHEGDKAPVGQELVMVRKIWRMRRLLPDFDFLSALMAFLFGPRMELKPIPIRVRKRR